MTLCKTRGNPNYCNSYGCICLKRFRQATLYFWKCSMWILKFPVVTFYQKWYLKHEFMSKYKFGRNFHFSRVQFKVTFWFFTIVPNSSLFFLIILILLVIANIHWRATIDLQYKKNRKWKEFHKRILCSMLLQKNFMVEISTLQS